MRTSVCAEEDRFAKGIGSVTVDGWRTRPRHARARGGLAQLDRPYQNDHGQPYRNDYDQPYRHDYYQPPRHDYSGWSNNDYFAGWPDYDEDGPEYSGAPSVTPHDVHVALGPQAEDMLRDFDVDVDQLIRLINAETTILPVIPDYVPEEFSQDRTGAHRREPDEEPERVLEVATKTWKRRFLRGAVVAILLTLTGGGAAALAMNKSVTITVDGKQQSVNTYGSTVGEALDSAGIKLGEHDALSPAPSAPVGNGGVIKLERGRQLDLVVDGKPRETWVRATTVEGALDQLGMTKHLSNGAWLSAPRDGGVPLDGMTLELKTLKEVKLYDGGNKARKLTTHAVTVGEFLTMEELKLGKKDEVAKGLDRKLSDGSEIHINRTGSSVVDIKETIEAPVKRIDDPELEVGKEKVEKPGKDGERLVTYRITKRNNVEVDREELKSKLLEKPETKVVRVGTKQPLLDDEAVWDRLAHCESTSNWSINTGNGYYGGLQFDKRTWDAYGGDEYAAYPHQASREQQIEIAIKLRDARGNYSAWPACRAKLGLP
ncbi:MAG: DUF348 domain-containing protein [Actinophytocola sp.]|nr:DUF348 domain-containing protein [Actinophytocola sp.]